MVNITALHDFLNNLNNYSRLKSLNLIGFYGSGIQEVLNEEISVFTRRIIIDFRYYNESDIRSDLYRYIFESILIQADPKLKKKLSDIDQLSINNQLYKIKYILEEINSESILLVFHNYSDVLDLREYLNDFLGYLVNNIKSNSIYTLFVTEKPISFESYSGLLYSFINSRKVYISGYTVPEIESTIDSSVKDLQSFCSKVIELTSGIPKLVDGVLEFMNEELKQSDTLQVNIFNSRSFGKFGNFKQLLEEYKYFYRDLLSWGSDNYLIDTKVSNSFTNFPKLIKQVYSLNYQDNIIELSDSILDKLSPQESKVIKYFMENEDEIVKKNKVAKIMELDGDDKQNSWAVDQLIKRLRDKINDRNNDIISTVRGRGYRFQYPN